MCYTEDGCPVECRVFRGVPFDGQGALQFLNLLLDLMKSHLALRGSIFPHGGLVLVTRSTCTVGRPGRLFGLASYIATPNIVVDKLTL